MGQTTRDIRKALSFRRGDFLALGLVLLLAVCVGFFFLPSTEHTGLTVEIRQNGVLQGSYPLSEDRTITVTGDYTNVIAIRDGAVWVEETDCPGGDCIHSGKIRTSGRAIVCLPNRVEIRLVGGAAGEIDMVVG